MCSAAERYSLCYAKDAVKRRNTACRQGGGELSLTEIFSFMHPFHVSGADVSGGFCGPAGAPALGGMFLLASVPVLAELIRGKITLQKVLCVRPNQSKLAMAICTVRVSAPVQGKGLCRGDWGRVGPTL